MAHSVMWWIGASEHCQDLIHVNELNEAESLRSQRDVLRHLHGIGDPRPGLDREKFSGLMRGGRLVTPRRYRSAVMSLIPASAAQLSFSGSRS
jgi:hypothetical protein